LLLSPNSGDVMIRSAAASSISVPAPDGLRGRGREAAGGRGAASASGRGAGTLCSTGPAAARLAVSAARGRRQRNPPHSPAGPVNVAVLQWSGWLQRALPIIVCQVSGFALVPR